MGAEVTYEAGDANQLVSMIERTEENLTHAGVRGSPKTLLSQRPTTARRTISLPSRTSAPP